MTFLVVELCFLLLCILFPPNLPERNPKTTLSHRPMDGLSGRKLKQKIKRQEGEFKDVDENTNV